MNATLCRAGKSLFRFRLWAALVLAEVCLHSAGSLAMTPAEWLRTQPQPNFQEGHRLPRLTRFGGALPLDARKELAAHWNYTVEFGSVSGGACYITEEVVARLNDRRSDEAQMAAWALADPRTYPLSVICNRSLPTRLPPETWTHDAAGNQIQAEAGHEWHPGVNTLFSPEAPDEVWQAAGDLRAGPLRALVARGLPIAIVLNGGEYGIGLPGAMQKFWEQDPAIVAAKGERTWAEYGAQRKGRSEKIIAESMRAAVPKRGFYIYYTAGGGTLRNKFPGVEDWSVDFDSIKDASDLPSNELYHHYFNDGFTGTFDMLTLALNAVAKEISAGRTHSYNWVSGGWNDPGREAPPTLAGPAEQAPIPRWTGFLTCCFTAGMMGCNAGYYADPPGGYAAAFAPENPPHWLRQLSAVAHAQARMSHVEDLLREGDLLPGPDRHRISRADSAYEFPTGDPTARVLVRRHSQRPEWLLTAWAAAGEAREVTVTVPDLGEVQLLAMPEAAVYRAVIENGVAVLDAVGW